MLSLLIIDKPTHRRTVNIRGSLEQTGPGGAQCTQTLAAVLLHIDLFPV